MKNLIYILIFSLLPISCSAQKNSNQKSPNEFDQKLADSLGADKYGMEPRSGEINSKGGSPLKIKYQK